MAASFARGPLADVSGAAGSAPLKNRFPEGTRSPRIHFDDSLCVLHGARIRGRQGRPPNHAQDPASFAQERPVVGFLRGPGPRVRRVCAPPALLPRRFGGARRVHPRGKGDLRRGDLDGGLVDDRGASDLRHVTPPPVSFSRSRRDFDSRRRRALRERAHFSLYGGVRGGALDGAMGASQTDCVRRAPRGRKRTAPRRAGLHDRDRVHQHVGLQHGDGHHDAPHRAQRDRRGSQTNRRRRARGNPGVYERARSQFRRVSSFGRRVLGFDRRDRDAHRHAAQSLSRLVHRDAAWARGELRSMDRRRGPVGRRSFCRSRGFFSRACSTRSGFAKSKGARRSSGRPSGGSGP